MRFPEVIDVISKTGRADIASDPMGIEVSDVIATLKPREEWTTTKSKEELVEKMRVALADLPGVASSFSQPIALRVDELVSGVKSAIGIKVFGDDLDVLKVKGEAIARVLSKVLVLHRFNLGIPLSDVSESMPTDFFRTISRSRMRINSARSRLISFSASSSVWGGGPPSPGRGA